MGSQSSKVSDGILLLLFGKVNENSIGLPSGCWQVSHSGGEPEEATINRCQAQSYPDRLMTLCTSPSEVFLIPMHLILLSMQESLNKYKEELVNESVKFCERPAILQWQNPSERTHRLTVEIENTDCF